MMLTASQCSNVRSHEQWLVGCDGFEADNDILDQPWDSGSILLHIIRIGRLPMLQFNIVDFVQRGHHELGSIEVEQGDIKMVGSESTAIDEAVIRVRP